MSSEPTLVGQTVGAFLSTLAANVRRAEERGEELHPSLISPAEIKLMEAFRRIGLEPEQQHPIGQYAADFYFPDVKLCVEVDGAHHAQQRDHDTVRDKRLFDRGIKTMRIPARHVGADADACALGVRRVIDDLQLKAL